MLLKTIFPLSLLPFLSCVVLAEFIPYGYPPPRDYGVPQKPRGPRSYADLSPECYPQTVYETVYKTKTLEGPLHSPIFPYQKQHHRPIVHTETVFQTKYVSHGNYNPHVVTETKYIKETILKPTATVKTVFDTRTVYHTKYLDKPSPYGSHPPVYTPRKKLPGKVHGVEDSFLHGLDDVKDLDLDVLDFTKNSDNGVLKSIENFKSNSGFDDEELTIGNFQLSSDFNDYDYNFFDIDHNKNGLLNGHNQPSKGNLVTKYSLDSSINNNFDLGTDFGFYDTKTDDLKLDEVSDFNIEEHSAPHVESHGVFSQGLSVGHLNHDSVIDEHSVDFNSQITSNPLKSDVQNIPLSNTNFINENVDLHSQVSTTGVNSSPVVFDYSTLGLSNPTEFFKSTHNVQQHGLNLNTKDSVDSSLITNFDFTNKDENLLKGATLEFQPVNQKSNLHNGITNLDLENLNNPVSLSSFQNTNGAITHEGLLNLINFQTLGKNPGVSGLQGYEEINLETDVKNVDASKLLVADGGQSFNPSLLTPTNLGEITSLSALNFHNFALNGQQHPTHNVVQSPQFVSTAVGEAQITSLGQEKLNTNGIGALELSLHGISNLPTQSPTHQTSLKSLYSLGSDQASLNLHDPSVTVVDTTLSKTSPVVSNVNGVQHSSNGGVIIDFSQVNSQNAVPLDLNNKNIHQRPLQVTDLPVTPTHSSGNVLKHDSIHTDFHEIENFGDTKTHFFDSFSNAKNLNNGETSSNFQLGDTQFQLITDPKIASQLVKRFARTSQYRSRST